jgi:hypothetical protein
MSRLGVLVAVVICASAIDRNVTFDERSAFVDGERQLMLSGAVHYPRVPPEDWDSEFPRSDSTVLSSFYITGVFKLAKSMGLNTIQTYVSNGFVERECVVLITTIPIPIPIK